jgi:hypothetical protein
MGAQERELHRLSNMEVGESWAHLQDSAMKEITFDQWKFLPQQNWPKSELNVWRIECMLPSIVIIIHPSKCRIDMRKNHTEQENYLPTQFFRTL